MLRVVFSLALLYVAYRLIHFEDVIAVRRDGITIDAKAVHEEGDQYRVVLEGSEQRLPKAGTTVEVREGFFSLFRRMDLKIYLLVAPLFLLTFLIMSVRWWILLRAHGFDVRFRDAFAVTYMGGFFNNFLPGSVGGDIARAVIAAKKEERKAAVVGTILLDRMIGLGSMILIAAVCLVPFATAPAMRQPLYIVGGLLLAMVVGYVLYFSRAIRDLGFVQRLKKGRAGEVIQDLDDTLKILKHRKKVVLACVLLSILGQSIAIVAIFGLARGLGVTQVQLVQFFVFEPVIFIITAIPISAGGWGVQEWSYQMLFGPAGVPANEAIAISILYKLTLILVSLPGGILFALGAARRRRESGTGPQVGGAAGDVPAHQ